ncbi:MAG: hypothetical protein ABL871_13045 [Terricaulis sp.]
MAGKPGDPSAIDGPHPERREAGVVRPERPEAFDPAEDTPDQEGIEIDNAHSRPQTGQPGQPGAKVN